MREPPGPCGAGRLRVVAAPLLFRAPEGCLAGPGCLMHRWAAARPLTVRAASFARRVDSLSGQALPPPTGAAAWPRHRPPAPRPSPAAAAWPRRHRVSKPALSLLINFACNSPSLSCRFVSVCSVMSLVFLNCMRLIFRTGPAAIRRYRERANLSLSDLPIDQTGCVRG